MNLIRLIAIALVIWITITLWRRHVQSRKVRKSSRRPRVTAMVRCDHCGVHVPQQEAVRSGDRSYCSREHRDAAEGR
ncbi:MAG TPA: PP0621 family protein [Gammaproteobacteria bacterium]|nr:PP0621 family protein [Gammaproteobacteria bacterium]